jgi:hypothetical protein
MRCLPPVPFDSDWKKTVAKSIGLVPKNAHESFIDIDGEFLLDRIRDLAKRASSEQAPIIFQ